MRPEEIAVEIGTLAGLDLSTLRGRWQILYGSAPPVRMSPELMIRAVAYRIQEDAVGGLSRAARMKLARLSSGVTRPRSATHRHRMKPGTRFLREWNGRTHEVIAVSSEQYLYQGRSYRSLSAIAREITGTRWSGPSFFGLRQRAKEKQHAQSE